MSTIVEPRPGEEEGALEIIDTSAVPAEPPADLFYQHRPKVLSSAVQTWRRKDVIFTLAERDIRASYKQQVLGFGWALITPVLTLIIFVVLLDHVKSFQTKHVPYALATYSGLWAWGLFGGAIGGGANSLIQNKIMMAKTHFPRECFPLSQILESAFTSTFAAVPLFVLFGIYGFPPKLGTLWLPLYIAIEIPFMVGAVLLVSSILVQARDLVQVMPILIQFGMLATPVIWPMSSKIHGVVKPIYSFLNPLGPVVDGIRNSMLLNHTPDWGLLAIAMCGSLMYLAIGYVVFKKLEVNFADLT